MIREADKRAPPGVMLMLIDAVYQKARKRSSTLPSRRRRTPPAQPAPPPLFLPVRVRFARIALFRSPIALRSAVREYLAASPLISRMRAGEEGEGGEGVTLAELR